RSIRATSNGALARALAAVSPPNPAPTMTTRGRALATLELMTELPQLDFDSHASGRPAPRQISSICSSSRRVAQRQRPARFLVSLAGGRRFMVLRPIEDAPRPNSGLAQR